MLSAIVVIKYYHKRDSGDYGKQGVTPQINRCTECDIKDEKRPKAYSNSRNDEEEGVTSQINKCKECDSDHVKLPLPRHGK